MRIGYCSPFNPMKSGISDFSEELIMHLKRHVEVVLFTPVELENRTLYEQFEVYKIERLNDRELRDSLDLIVYQVGNNLMCHGEILEMLDQHAGIVELHDVGLHYLAAEQAVAKGDWNEYLKLAEFCHGTRGKKIVQAYLNGTGIEPWEAHPFDMSMNRKILEKATGVIVHSEAAKQMVLGIREDVPIANIMLHSMDIVDDIKHNQLNCRNKLNLAENQIIIGSFGFATQTKRVLPILNALAKLREEHQNFLYVLVGEVAKEIDIQKELQVRNLSDCVMVTGFASLEDFKLYMGACDFCLNLRYPTQGESSGSLHRMLGMGKPAIVTDIGTFADYPDDVVLKVRYDEREVDDIYNTILQLLDKKGELEKRSKKAWEFAKEHCDLEKNVQQYADFFHQVHTHTWQAEYEDVVIGRLCELGLTKPDYLETFYNNVKDCLC